MTKDKPPKKVTCEKCNGTGRLWKKKGRQIQCYECEGYGFFWVEEKDNS